MTRITYTCGTGPAVASRDAFGQALVELGREVDNLVVLDADLGTSTKASLFADAFPARFIQVGIAEQNMMGIAAGLALAGWIPVTSTFACFASKRALDQVRASIAQPKLNVKTWHMNALPLIAATLGCGGMAFLVYRVPVVSQIVVIGLLGFVWFFYARNVILAVAGRTD